jgi:HSP20 family molecular chaperone IbpA
MQKKRANNNSLLVFNNETISNTLTNFKDKFFTKHFNNLKKGFMIYEEPFCEIRQNHKGMKITIKLPEVNKKDIFLNITQDKLELKAKALKKGKVLTNYHKIVDLPHISITKKAKADYKNKNLKIDIPYKLLRD